MKRSLSLTFVSVLVALLLIVPAHSFAKDKGETGKMAPKRMELRQAMRDLWVGHIFWVRNVALTTKFGDAGAAKVAEEQVVQDAKDIANAVVPFYGKDAGDKLFNLLAGHYGAVKEYMNAAFAGNKDAKTSAMDKLNKNADEIATFLSSANPNWSKSTLLAALAAHGGHHVAQIEAINGKDFAADAKVWNDMKTHMYVIADYLADGIVKQFAHKK